MKKGSAGSVERQSSGMPVSKHAFHGGLQGFALPWQDGLEKLMVRLGASARTEKVEF